MNLTKLSSEDSLEIEKEINDYKKLRHLIQFGDFYRLKSPFSSNQAAWNFVSKDQKRSFSNEFQYYVAGSAGIYSDKVIWLKS